mgnify:CR=1 FL=1
MSSSNRYLRYRGFRGNFGGYSALAFGVSVVLLEFYFRGFGLVGGECRLVSDFTKLLLPQILCGVRETPWSNFSDVLLALTFLAAATIGVFVAGGNSPNVKNDNSAREHALGASRADLADEAVEYCAFFVAVYLWRTLILTSAKIFVAVVSPEKSVREEAPDLIVFGALGVGILGCRWINRALIPKVHVLRLGLEVMERRKWRLALLEAELKRTLELDCGVGKHVVPLAGRHPYCVWIIRWLPVVRVSLASIVFGASLWISAGYREGRLEENLLWQLAMIPITLVVFSEFVSVSTDKSHHVDRGLKFFVEGSRAPFWRNLVFDNGLRLMTIPPSIFISCFIIRFSDHKTLLLGVLCLVFVVWHVAVSFVAAMPRMHRKEGVWDASWWTELKEWKERGLGNVSPEQARCALVLQDYMRAEAEGRFRWLRSPVTRVRKPQGPAGKSMKSMKNQIEKDCALLVDAIEDMGGGKSSTQ